LSSAVIRVLAAARRRLASSSSHPSPHHPATAQAALRGVLAVVMRCTGAFASSRTSVTRALQGRPAGMQDSSVARRGPCGGGDNGSREFECN
jgi:hypothetical protein